VNGDDPRKVLSRHGLGPKKSWGQNFLHDRAVLARIVAAVGARADDTVVEIGAGLGTLTAALARAAPAARRILAVERDPDMQRVLRAELADDASVEIVDADALAFDYTAARREAGRPLVVVGNLPYQIASALIVTLVRAGGAVARAIVMVQRELAQRIVAPPGSRTYGRLSVTVQQNAEAKLLFHVRPGAFTQADLGLLSAAGAILASTLSRQVAFDEARRRSVTDELTGLANRAHFLSRVEEEIEKSKRYGHPFALVLVDPQRFASINQAYGRPYGDSCLVALAELLKTTIRKSDLVGRLAPGDEFAVLMPHQTADAARQAALRVRQAIGGHTFPRRRRLGADVGVACYPADGPDAAALLARATRDLIGRAGA